MIRNGFYLPSIKSTIVTVDYMQNVRYKVIWCLMYGEIKLLPCPNPPNKFELISEFEKLAKAIGAKTGITDLKVPDKGWLLAAIGTLKPDHAIF